MYVATRYLGSVATALIFGAVIPAHGVSQTAIGGQVELGALGTFTTFDRKSIGLTADGGAGGRLGLYFSRLLALEARGDFTRSASEATGAQVDLSRLSGTLYVLAPKTAVGRFYLGAGYTRSEYRGGVDGSDDGGHLVLGDLVPLWGRMALRFEGRMDLIPSPAIVDTAGAALNFGASAGISIFAFGGPPRDSDRDGIPDKVDGCPDTPARARVDARGCPLDADRDGVFDGLDRCASTRTGAVVDAAGCPLDRDGDAVPDGIDVCPNSPRGAAVDANGCPVDGDGDGVFDGLDRCPDTPSGAIVDADGCAVDSDGDSVPDGLDRCPDTRSGFPVDSEGCALDSDGDGVPDGVDRCPDSPAGQDVDEMGCPLLFAQPEAPLVLQGVNFGTGRSVLTEESYGILDGVAQALLARPDVRVEIAGHTDVTGSRGTNTRLSLERAQAVMAYLAQRGVAPSRMEARGYGPDRPIAPNSTAAGRARNRRVELHRLDEGP
jgi:outer membrane protein OmpA-like peptidoglycan-associated protein